MIRAQTRPYPGAFSFLSGFRMNIWSANVFDTKLQLSNKQAVIVDVLDDKSFIVQCNGGLLRVSDYCGSKPVLGATFKITLEICRKVNFTLEIFLQKIIIMHTKVLAQFLVV